MPSTHSTWYLVLSESGRLDFEEQIAVGFPDDAKLVRDNALLDDLGELIEPVEPGGGFVGAGELPGRDDVRDVAAVQDFTDATVTFISEEGQPEAAYGLTDAQGVAKMKTYEEGDGAVLGKQKVVINKEQILNSVKVADQDSPDYAPLPPGGAPLPKVKHLVPVKYTAPGTTTLTADVTAKGPNEFTFELKD